MKPADRITSGPVDPDLEAVLPGLARAAYRLRQLDGILRDPSQKYGNLQAQRSERADIAASFTATAERLKMPGERPGLSLLMLVERADDLYKARRRRPTLAQVLQGLTDAAPAAERDADTAEAEAKMAAGAAREVRRRCDGILGARRYLEACAS
jgi:hypothetical protein